MKFAVTKPRRAPLANMAQGLSPGEVVEDKPEVKQEEWHENLNVRLICKDCREDPPNLTEDHSSGDTICASCGMVLAERSIDTSSEWRTFRNDDQAGGDDPSRVGDGPNALLNGAQLSTGIAYGDGMRSKELHRAQNKTNMDKGNKALLQAYKEIGSYCEVWQLPPAVQETAKHIYKDAEESRQFKGKSTLGLQAGCIFLACRKHNVPRSFREVTELTQVSKKEVGRVFKKLEEFLMKRDKDNNGATTMVGGGQTVFNNKYEGSVASSPADMCRRYCNMLGLDMTTKVPQTAEDLATVVYNSASLAGRSPLSQAAACIYMASHLMGLPKNAKDIQNVAHVSDSTIRQAYKLLWLEKDTLITPELIARGADVTRLPKPN